MTYKRFGAITNFCVYEKIDEVIRWLTFDEIVTILNQLNDENEQLKEENKELRQDNDIKFWKMQCLESSNNNQVMLFELSRVIKQGYEVSA